MKWNFMPGLSTGRSGQSVVKEAIRSVHHGKPGELELIYQSYSQLVRRICLRMLRDPSEAEDAAQDVFIQVLLKLHTFRGEAAFSSWLYRLTTNTVLMRFRKRNHEPIAQIHAENESEPRNQIGASDSYLRGLLERIDLHDAVKLLPEGYKTAFILHDIEGYRHKEIAGIIGYSAGTSKSQLHKARMRLRELLQGKPAGEMREESGHIPKVRGNLNKGRFQKVAPGESLAKPE